MRNLLLCLGILMISSFGLIAQTEEQTTPTTPTSPSDGFGQMEELFHQFNFEDLGSNMMIDTMIFRQFGSSNMGNADMDELMGQMMQMMQEQMQGFDFGEMPGFDQLFEGLEFEDPNALSIPVDPNQPNADPKTKKKMQKKKRKTYKL